MWIVGVLCGGDGGGWRVWWRFEFSGMQCSQLHGKTLLPDSEQSNGSIHTSTYIVNLMVLIRTVNRNVHVDSWKNKIIQLHASTSAGVSFLGVRC